MPAHDMQSPVLPDAALYIAVCMTLSLTLTLILVSCREYGIQLRAETPTPMEESMGRESDNTPGVRTPDKTHTPAAVCRAESSQKPGCTHRPRTRQARWTAMREPMQLRRSTWATTTALWYSRTSGVGGVRGSTPFCCRLTLPGEALREVVAASSSCRAANLLHTPRSVSGRTPALRDALCGQ